MNRLRQHTASTGAREPDVFRRRVDDKISVEEYIKHLDEQVRQRQQAEEHPQREQKNNSDDA